MENKQPCSDVINTAYMLEGKLVYKKLKNRYRIFCMKCQRYEYVSKQEFKQIQASHICPMCYQEVKLSRVLEHQMYYYIMDDDLDGFRILIDFKFGCKPKIYTDWVFRYDNEVARARYIRCNMGYSFTFDPAQYEWKKKRNAQSYFYRFYSIKDATRYESKKEYIYKALFNRGHRSIDIDKIIKSNQKKIIQDNLLNGQQMEYIIAFDLKSYDDVYKYRRYINQNNYVDIRKPLNIYYLDYLYRNNIILRDFYDYMNQCKELGFKLDKPKDFKHRHFVLSELLIQKRDAEDEKKCSRRYKALIKKMYSDGTVEIKAFKTSKEIIDCGKKLHNCIGTYVSRYARRETDLFYLTSNNKIKIAIEVKRKKLIQARADHNEDCPAKYMKHIRKWCKLNDYVCY